MSETKNFLPDFCSVRIVFSVIIIAELLAITLTLAATESHNRFFSHLSLLSIYIQWIALTCAALLCLLRRRLQRHSSTVTAVVSYSLILLITALFSEIAYLINQQLNMIEIVTGPLEFLARNLAVAAIVSLLSLRYFYLQHQLKQNIETEHQARIQALHARIRPHFLFNSLNTIASLIRSRPREAEEAVEDLADLFRHTLKESQTSAPFHRELEVAERYLSMEKLRLGERLNIDWQLGEIPANATLPALTLQPLLENAVYHGIEKLSSGGTIRCHGELKGKRITLTLSNPVPTSAGPAGSGHRIALDNLHQRLKAHYTKPGQEASLSIQEKEEYFEITLSFPYQPYIEQ